MVSLIILRGQYNDLSNGNQIQLQLLIVSREQLGNLF